MQPGRGRAKLQGAAGGQAEAPWAAVAAERPAEQAKRPPDCPEEGPALVQTSTGAAWSQSSLGTYSSNFKSRKSSLTLDKDKVILN